MQSGHHAQDIVTEKAEEIAEAWSRYYNKPSLEAVTCAAALASCGQLPEVNMMTVLYCTVLYCTVLYCRSTW